MASEQSTKGSPFPSAAWPLPAGATLGSSVRTAGIERDIKARLPWAARRCLSVEAGRVVLRMPEDGKAKFEAVCAIVAETLAGIAARPVLPSEAEDILAISPRERQKWTKDGRLRSAGTRTVKLRGRAKAVTFHVFDPRHVEDVLDRDLAVVWREEDAQAASEARRRAAGKAALTRAGKGNGGAAARAAGKARDEAPRPKLDGWEAFEADGLLR